MIERTYILSVILHFIPHKIYIHIYIQLFIYFFFVELQKNIKTKEEFHKAEGGIF